MPSQINYISCTSINQNLTMLTNAGVNINDSVQVRNHLNIYYNRNYSYEAYSQVLSGCANQTLNYVLALPGIEAEEAKEGYRYGFNGMPKEDEMSGDGNTYDYGARIYNSRLGKWISVDPMQNIYPSISPYAYVANSPISLVDPDGKQIEIYWTKRRWGKPVMHIKVTGVLINSTGKLLPDYEVRNANLAIKERLESRYNKNYGSFKVKIEYNMRVGNSDDVKEEDHVIHLANTGELYKDEHGYTNALGGKIMWLDYSFFWNNSYPTVPHEFGHWLGLLHPENYEPVDLFVRTFMGKQFGSLEAQQMLLANFFYWNNQLNRYSNKSSGILFSSGFDPENYQNIDFSQATEAIGNFLKSLTGAIGDFITKIITPNASEPNHPIYTPRYL